LSALVCVTLLLAKIERQDRPTVLRVIRFFRNLSGLIFLQELAAVIQQEVIPNVGNIIVDIIATIIGE
jgi:hypothetical protein